MIEYISRNHGHNCYEIIIKTTDPGFFKAAENFARWLVDQAKPATDNNVGSKWIPVTERLPEIDADVLMYFADDDNMTAGFLVDVEEDTSMWSAYSDGGYYTDCDYVPTHWMPMPEPPKEVE